MINKLFIPLFVLVIFAGVSVHACNDYICGMIMYSPNKSAAKVCKIYKNKEMHDACIELYPVAENDYKKGQCRKLSFLDSIKTKRILKNFR